MMCSHVSLLCQYIMSIRPIARNVMTLNLKQTCVVIQQQVADQFVLHVWVPSKKVADECAAMAKDITSPLPDCTVRFNNPPSSSTTTTTVELDYTPPWLLMQHLAAVDHRVRGA